MKQDKAERARLRLAAAESNLRELSELLDASLGVERDLCQRIRDGDSSRNLKNQGYHYARIIGRILDGYFVALDEYLAAVSESAEVLPRDDGSNGAPPFPGGISRNTSVM